MVYIGPAIRKNGAERKRTKSDPKEIASMLMLPFVENSFKRGASQQLEQVWVHIEVVIQEDLLKVRVANSKAIASPAHDIDVVPKGNCLLPLPT